MRLRCVVKRSNDSGTFGAPAAAPALGALLSLAGMAWYAVLMWPIVRAAQLGPICSHAGSLALHCPSCYAALALVGTGLGVMLVGAGPAIRTARAGGRG